MPFSIPVPNTAAPSFEISPVEQSLLDVSYSIEAAITEKAPNDGSTQLISNKSPVQIVKEISEQVQMNSEHVKEFKSTGFAKLTKILSSKEFSAKVVMYSSVIQPNFLNEFRITIDNSKCN